MAFQPGGPLFSGYPWGDEPIKLLSNQCKCGKVRSGHSLGYYILQLRRVFSRKINFIQYYVQPFT